MTSEPADYPITYSVRRDETQSRLTNFPLFIGTFIRLILLIPHLIVVAFLGLAAVVIYFIATFAILFTGSFPEGMYNFIVMYNRWSLRVMGYMLHYYDKYPPFAGGPDETYPLSFDAVYPAASSRLLNLPFLGYVIRALLLIPHFIITYFLNLAMYLVIFIALFGILFSGSFPEGMHRFTVGASRWSARMNAYIFGLTDKYPPFSTD